MNIFWKELSDDKAKVKEKLTAARPVLELLERHAKDTIKKTQTVRKPDYSSKDWLPEQCHRNGIVDYATQILGFVSDTQEEKQND